MFHLLSDFEEITEIDLSSMRLTRLPEYIFECKNLTTLDISHNFIRTLTNLPDTLLSLNCSHNPIRTLSTFPKSLYFLNCSYCLLDDLPPLPSSISYLSCSNQKGRKEKYNFWHTRLYSHHEEIFFIHHTRKEKEKDEMISLENIKK